ncbi:MFS transporter [Bacillus sp. HNG]|uniref:MFS transporter n=1 Tax=Bacillus sp. HNG TaxID=2293325 RepID=UPI000E2ED72B|nr:MFS transporter [Bacillus sp. HNG]RFB12686.1 MFS transporter [Bacillus sp. HNG]
MGRNESFEYGKSHTNKLLLLSLAMLGTMTTWFSMTAVLPTLMDLWVLNSNEVSYITIMVNLGFIVGSLVSAFMNLPDRLQPHILFFWSAVLAGVSTILTAILANSLMVALIFRFITGISLSGVYGPGLKLVSTWFRLRRGTALGLVVGALTIGSAGPHLFKGIGISSWELVLTITGLCSILSGILILFVKIGPYPLPPGNFDPKAILRAFKNHKVRLANFGYFGHMWELYAMWSWFGLFLAESFKTSGMSHFSSPASIVTFVVIASGFFGAWFGGVFADRIGREEVTLWSLGVSGTITLIIGFFFGSSPWIMTILGIIWGVSIIADSAQFSAIITEHSDQRYVGSSLTVQLAIGYILTIIVIFLMPFIESIIGWKYTFLILLPGPILGFLSMYRLHRIKTRVTIVGLEEVGAEK